MKGEQLFLFPGVSILRYIFPFAFRYTELQMKTLKFAIIALISAISVFSLHCVSIALAQSGFHPWDVNNDGVVDMADLIFVVENFGGDTSTGADVNDDGIVDILDIVLVGRHLGEKYGPHIYTAPIEEAPSNDYTVNVNGKPVFVYKARVSAVPLNQVWPGYQRPLDQTEIASFAYWDMSEPVSVEVLSNRPVKSVDIRPWSYGIRPNVSGNRIEFQMPRPGQITVEVNGTHNALHLFVNPLEEDIPNINDPKVMYFGPGIHYPGIVELKSSQTVYIAGGSVVHASIISSGSSGIRILGRGILDNSTFERGKAPGPIALHKCSDVKINGIIIRDSNAWTITPSDCQNVAISNIKLIGLWRYNADGIDIVNCQHVTIDECFVRSFDDSIAIKGLQGTGEKPIYDVVVSDCVIWNDWGRALEIGAETVAPEISGVVFRNCDIIRSTHIAMDIQHGDRALVRDVRFEDIRFEIDDHTPQPQSQQERDEKYNAEENRNYCPNLLVLEIRQNSYSKDEERGRIQDIYVKDIQVIGKPFPESYFRGYDTYHRVENVTIENLRIGGRLITNAKVGRFFIMEHVDNVRFIAEGVVNGSDHTKLDPKNIAGIWLFDEGNGNIAKDSSENKNDGTIMNGPKWVDGRFGKGLSFDGEGGVRIESTPKLQLGKAFTMMAYFNASILEDWHQLIAKDGEYLLRIDPPAEGGRMSSFVNIDGWEPRASAGIPKINTWYHFAAVYDGSAEKLFVYVDGVLVNYSDRRGNPTATANAITIGHWNDGSSFKGVIDEIAIFDAALADEDIAIIAKNGLKSILGSATIVSPADRLTSIWSGLGPDNRR